MAITYIACFLVVLQVVSSKHTISTDVPTTSPSLETTSEQDPFDSNSTIDYFSTTSQDTNITENENVTETTAASLNITETTTEEDTITVDTIEYVSVADDSTPEPTQTPAPIDNMATILSQPGLLVLLPISFGFMCQFSPLWWLKR